MNIVWIAILIAGLLGGCVSEHRHCGEISFSPDGSMVSFSWNYEETRMPMEWLWPTYYWYGSKTQFLCLASSETPEICPQFRVFKDRACPDFLAKFAVSHIRISPDTNHVAWICEGRLVVAQTHNPKVSMLLTPTDEIVDTFCWVGKEELVYSSSRIEERPELASICHKGLYRQIIYTTEDEKNPRVRTKLFSALSGHVDEPPFETYIAPDKTAALLMGRTRVTLVEFDPKKAANPIQVERRSGKDRGICWAPDSKKIFLAFGWDEDAEGPDGAILLNRIDGKVTDFSDDFLEMFGTNPFRCNEWTVDGKFLIAMDLRMLRIYLIQLDPWVVYRFEERYDKKLPKIGGDVKWVHSLVPGWLWVRPLDGGPTYAIDYQGRRVIPIAERTWAVSPDHTQIAEVFEKGHVHVRTLNLPKLSEFSPIANQATQAGTTKLKSHKKQWWWQNRPGKETPEKRVAVKHYDVLLTKEGNNKLVMVKVLEISAGLSRAEAYERIKTLPVLVGENLLEEDAQGLITALEAAGATVEKKEHIKAETDKPAPKPDDTGTPKEVPAPKDLDPITPTNLKPGSLSAMEQATRANLKPPAPKVELKPAPKPTPKPAPAVKTPAKEVPPAVVIPEPA